VGSPIIDRVYDVVNQPIPLVRRTSFPSIGDQHYRPKTPMPDISDNVHHVGCSCDTYKVMDTKLGMEGGAQK
jgi:hypothetical protein